jgi:hypothetical protein
LTAAQSVKVTIGGCGWSNPKNKINIKGKQHGKKKIVNKN